MFYECQKCGQRVNTEFFSGTACPKCGGELKPVKEEPPVRFYLNLPKKKGGK